jgi:preprotein translocase subunit SecA
MFLQSTALHGGSPGNIISQVGTGEGKSLIIAMLAAFYVLKGAPRVNVLVDNLSLLERDYATFDTLYAALGITACSAAQQQTIEPSTQVCYHTAHSLEVLYLQGLTAGAPAAIPEGAVLIVDEVRHLRTHRHYPHPQEFMLLVVVDTRKAFLRGARVVNL